MLFQGEQPGGRESPQTPEEVAAAVRRGERVVQLPKHLYFNWGMRDRLRMDGTVEFYEEWLPGFLINLVVAGIFVAFGIALLVITGVDLCSSMLALPAVMLGGVLVKSALWYRTHETRVVFDPIRKAVRIARRSGWGPPTEVESPASAARLHIGPIMLRYVKGGPLRTHALLLTTLKDAVLLDVHRQPDQLKSKAEKLAAGIGVAWHPTETLLVARESIRY